MIHGITCAGCIFFSPPSFQTTFSGQRAMGQCRRHAPLMDRTDRGPRTIWPLVGDHQWCGEHSTFDEDE